MKKITSYLLCTCLLRTLLTACTKKQQDAIANGLMEADISGSGHYSATDVSSRLTDNPAFPNKKQLTISSSMGSKTLTIAVVDLDENNPLGTYSFSSTTTHKAIGGYNSGGGVDDIIITGTLQITTTAAGHLQQGTFSGTTQHGFQITNGTFSATY